MQLCACCVCVNARGGEGVCECKAYLQRESSQGRNGHQGSHEEGDHVVDGGQSDAGACAT